MDDEDVSGLLGATCASETLNPHNWLSRHSNGLWKCRYCGDVGTYDELQSRACS